MYQLVHRQISVICSIKVRIFFLYGAHAVGLFIFFSFLHPQDGNILDPSQFARFQDRKGTLWTQNPVNDFHMSDEVAEKTLIRHIYQGKVSTTRTPVMILRDGEFDGCGTLLKNGHGLPVVVTAKHLFREPNWHSYSYRILRPYQSATNPISNIHYPADPYVEWAICTLDAPQKISGSPQAHNLLSDKPSYYLRAKELTLTSLNTGKRYQSKLVMMTRESSYSYERRVIFVRGITLWGESGGGFISDEGDLYLCGQFVNLTHDERKSFLKIGVHPPSMSQFAFILEKFPLQELQTD